MIIPAVRLTMQRVNTVKGKMHYRVISNIMPTYLFYHFSYKINVIFWLFFQGFCFSSVVMETGDTMNHKLTTLKLG